MKRYFNVEKETKKILAKYLKQKPVSAAASQQAIWPLEPKLHPGWEMIT